MRRAPLVVAAVAAALIVPASPATSVEEIAASTISVVALTDSSGGTTPIGEAGIDALTSESSAPSEDNAPEAPVEGAVPEESPADEPAPAPTEAPANPPVTDEAPAPAIEPGIEQDLSQIAGGGAAGTTGRVVLDVPEPGSSDEIAVRTEPLATDTFTVAGFTWDGQFDPGATNPIYVRLFINGEWTEWSEVGSEEGGPDGSTDGGSDPIIAPDATAIQVEIHGSVSDLPANLQLAIVPEYGEVEAPAVTEATDAVGVAPDAATVSAPEKDVAASPAPALGETVATTLSGGPAGGASLFPTLGAMAPVPPGTAPRIISRDGWGANRAILNWSPVYANLRGAVVHHTAGTNNYTAAQSAGIVRGIYSYHAVTRGWGDIGYNFLVDKYGQVFEGRFGTLSSRDNQMVIGGHARPYNTGTLGISVLGNYVSVTPSTASLEQVAGTIAWRFTLARINPKTPSGLISQGIGTYASGRSLPRVMAHREVAATTCPGDTFYNEFMGSLRNRVVNGSLPPMTFYLENQYDPIADISLNYGRSTDMPLAGDWNGDGRDTVGYRRGMTLTLTNSTGSTPVTHLEFNYGDPGDIVHVGDWDGDGRDSFLIQRGTWFYLRNSLTSGVAERVFSYGNPGDQVLVGDWNGDGIDTLAVRRGNVFYVRNSLTTGVADRVFHYGDPGDEVFVGDWNGDRVDTIAIRRLNVFFVRNTLTTGVATTTFPFGNPGDAVIVGDWDGDGKDTFGVTRPAW